MTDPLGLEVLGDDDGGSQVGGQGLDQLGERLYPAGRGADDDEVRKRLGLRQLASSLLDLSPGAEIAVALTPDVIATTT